MATLQEVLAAARQVAPPDLRGTRYPPVPATPLIPPLESMDIPPNLDYAETANFLKNVEFKKYEAEMFADWFLRRKLAEMLNDPVRANVPLYGEVPLAVTDAVTGAAEERLGVKAPTLTDVAGQVWPAVKAAQLGLRALPAVVPEAARYFREPDPETYYTDSLFAPGPVGPSAFDRAAERARSEGVVPYTGPGPQTGDDWRAVNMRSNRSAADAWARQAGGGR